MQKGTRCRCRGYGDHLIFPYLIQRKPKKGTPVWFSIIKTEVDEVKIRYHFHYYTVMYNSRDSLKVGLFKMYQMQ